MRQETADKLRFNAMRYIAAYRLSSPVDELVDACYGIPNAMLCTSIYQRSPAMAETVTKPTAKPNPQANGPKPPSTPPVTQSIVAAGGGNVDALAKARAARAPSDPNESKAAKFRRLANHRVPRAMKSLAAIESLANRSAYEFTDEQADKIVEVLAEAVATIRNRLNGEKPDRNKWSL